MEVLLYPSLAAKDTLEIKFMPAILFSDKWHPIRGVAGAVQQGLCAPPWRSTCFGSSEAFMLVGEISGHLDESGNDIHI